MNAGIHRKPIGNFFIKRSLQLRMTIKIVSIVLLTTLASIISMVAVYYIKYNTVVVYQLDKLTQDLSRENIIFLILPTLIFSAFINLVLAFGIGFYASRKYAIPVYKLEQWCKLLLQGKLSALLLFREKEELNELSIKCNELTHYYREKFEVIHHQVQELKKTMPESAPLKKIEGALLGLDITTDPIEVNTVFYQLKLHEEKQILPPQQQ